MQKSRPPQEATRIFRGVLFLALGVFIGVFLTLWTVKATLFDISRQQIAAKNNTTPTNISTPKASSSVSGPGTDVAMPAVSFSLNPNSPRGIQVAGADREVFRFDIKVIDTSTDN